MKKHQFSTQKNRTALTLPEMVKTTKKWQSELTTWDDELQELHTQVFQLAETVPQEQLPDFRILGGEIGSDLPNWLDYLQERIAEHQQCLLDTLSAAGQKIDPISIAEHQSLQQLISDFNERCQTARIEIQLLHNPNLPKQNFQKKKNTSKKVGIIA